MGNKVIWYTAVLIGMFLVLTNYQGVNDLLRSGFRGYGGIVGILQGRQVSLGNTSTSVGAIAR